MTSEYDLYSGQTGAQTYSPVTAGVSTLILMLLVMMLTLPSQFFYGLLPQYTGLPTGLISLWKELLLAVAAGTYAIDYLSSNHDHPRVMQIDTLFFIIFCLFVSLLLVYIVASEDQYAAWYGFRGFIEPFAVFYLAKRVKLDFRTVKTFMRYLFVLGVVIAVWAVFQAAILGDTFLINMGYPSKNGRLHFSFYIYGYFFQRAVGTFISANTFGIFVQMIIMSGLYLYYSKSIKRTSVFYLAMAVLLVGLVYSFSRSSWIAVIASALLLTSLRSTIRSSLTMLVKAMLVLSISLLVLYGVRGDIIKPLLAHTTNTVTMKDPSAAGHLESLINSVNFSLANPLGVGLGMSGPRGSSITGKFLNSENSFFIVSFDLGIFGVVVYSSLLLLILMSLILSVKKNTSEDVQLFRMSILAMFAGQMIAWNFIPYIVELETTLMLFFLLGLALNTHINDYQVECNGA